MLKGKSYQGRTISALCERGKVHHFGTFPHLEDLMCEWDPGVEKLPDRIDALVWSITKLTEGSIQLGDFDLSKLMSTSPRLSGFDVLDQFLLMKFFQISKFDRPSRSQ